MGIRDIATRLVGGEVNDLEAVHGGRNNSIFRVRRADGVSFALKRYVPPRETVLIAWTPNMAGWFS